ncbi:hypothetical protein J6590_035829 [Homalodisca vitripennis]|nr:hypothetical protein J6590_035829 [Homalodisca vitripennis]
MSRTACWVDNENSLVRWTTVLPTINGQLRPEDGYQPCKLGQTIPPVTEICPAYAYHMNSAFNNF